ncbi:MAG: hypothetical protein J5614_04025 [Paludibacteraceae bacterium]|nr:hypothetical protein [Paludibacteraceae bacterium]
MLNEISLISSIAAAISNSGKGNPQNRMDLEEAYTNLKSLSSPNSLSKKAKSGIFEFPFLVSGNIENTATTATIIKTMECEYANMLLISMGINPSADMGTNLKVQRTLSTYHTNGTDFSFENNTYNKDIETRSLDVAFEAKGNGGNPPPPASNPDQLASVMGNANNFCNADYAKMYGATMITVKLRLNGSQDSEFSIPLGIKGIPHHIPTDELVYVLSSFIKPRADSFVIRFIKWRTGEIRGLHNLLFRYDEIKRDADFDRRVGTSNSWLSVLKARAANRKVNVIANIFSKLGGHNANMKEILPNCTFVLTLSDVDTIENETGVNIFTNVNAAKKLLDDSMGLGLVILDETHDVVHIMYSGYNKFASYPASSLKGKVKTGIDATEVMLNLLNRI